MPHRIVTGLAVASMMAVFLPASIAAAHDDDDHGRRHEAAVQLGPRPFFLVNDMAESRLKRQLQSCTGGPFSKSDFSIGHRGAALQFPEHTRESYEAGARMGAGIVE